MQFLLFFFSIFQGSEDAAGDSQASEDEANEVYSFYRLKILVDVYHSGLVIFVLIMFSYFLGE